MPSPATASSAAYTVRPRPFAQVNVFSSEPTGGNPVAVVLDGSDLTDAQMLDFARWTNLAETTFVLPPTTPDADYRLRIFTPVGELPFAGHPTLGSALAWLDTQHATEPSDPQSQDMAPEQMTEVHIVQECAAGLIPVTTTAPHAPGTHHPSPVLWFTAPPTVRSGPLEPELLTRITTALHLTPEDILAHQWVDNGPGWAAVLLPSADHVLDLTPDFGEIGDLHLGVVGAYPPGSDHAIEVRAFTQPAGTEDPVTGSLNASLAQWLVRTGVLPDSYTASQGTCLGFRGVVHVHANSAASTTPAGTSATPADTPITTTTTATKATNTAAAPTVPEVHVGGAATVTIRGTVLL